MALSKTQVDKLGNRLRLAKPTEIDVRELDEYRRAFVPAYEAVVATIRERLTYEPTGRPAKSTSSIIEKLRRESIRLSQIQDIAGCRIIVEDIERQDGAVSVLADAFPGAVAVDRRIHPSHGYRAVHLIAVVLGRQVEIQVRTVLQHLWAEVCEKCADVIDPAAKYGGGPEDVQKYLRMESELLSKMEAMERKFANHPVVALLGRAVISEHKESMRRRLSDILASLDKVE